MPDGDVGFTLATTLVVAVATALASITFFTLIMASIIAAICSFMASMSASLYSCTSSALPITLALDMGLKQFRFSTWSMTSCQGGTGSNRDIDIPKMCLAVDEAAM
ncbi:hypothetical protein GmHk_20G057651 [Glycine max]|nr:hypothetical protein GmHk_20G057651 [Glycine max]